MLNKWALIDEGEYYHTGQIVWVSDTYILLRVQPVASVPQNSRLFALEDVSRNMSVFFDDEEELDDFLEWLEEDTSQKLKVVPIGNKK